MKIGENKLSWTIYQPETLKKWTEQSNQKKRAIKLERGKSLKEKFNSFKILRNNIKPFYFKKDFCPVKKSSKRNEETSSISKIRTFNFENKKSIKDLIKEKKMIKALKARQDLRNFKMRKTQSFFKKNKKFKKFFDQKNSDFDCNYEESKETKEKLRMSYNSGFFKKHNFQNYDRVYVKDRLKSMNFQIGKENRAISEEKKFSLFNPETEQKEEGLNNYEEYLAKSRFLEKKFKNFFLNKKLKSSNSSKIIRNDPQISLGNVSKPRTGVPNDSKKIKRMLSQGSLRIKDTSNSQNLKEKAQKKNFTSLRNLQKKSEKSPSKSQELLLNTKTSKFSLDRYRNKYTSDVIKISKMSKRKKSENFIKKKKGKSKGKNSSDKKIIKNRWEDDENWTVNQAENELCGIEICSYTEN